jgi:hypothetical protein
LILDRPSKKRNSKNPNPIVAEFFHSFRGIEGDFMVILLISLAFEIHFSKG